MIGTAHRPNDYSFPRQQSRETEEKKLVASNKLPWAYREETWPSAALAGVCIVIFMALVVML